jgi:hypothetical protein
VRYPEALASDMPSTDFEGMSLAMRRTVLVFAALLAPWTLLPAQTEYYNLDAGRPTRVEDAVSAERYALELLLGGLRVERLAGGVQRWRTEPKAVYGILPFTEVEVRVPVVRSFLPGVGAAFTGIAGVGIGALHAFNLETLHLPALALSSEVLLPGGEPFGAPSASYSVKALLTRSTRIARLHLNGAVGTYSVRPVAAADTVGCGLISLTGTCVNGRTTPVPPDFPCASQRTSEPMHAAVAAASAPPDATPSKGNRWLVGLGADHGLPLQSLLISGDVFAERFIGLYQLTDWTAELGVRRQLTPTLVFDLGAVRRFAGAVQSSAATIGFTYHVATRHRVAATRP